MIKDKVGIKGRYQIKIKKKDGTYKDLWQENALGRFIFEKLGLELRLPFLGSYTKEYCKDNLVVNAGLAGIASRINGDGGEAAFTYIALGSDDTAAAAGDTTLGTELAADGLSRASATASRETENVTNDKAKLVKTFTYTASTSTSIKEVGILNAASAGTMLSRTVITTKTVDENGETIEISYTIYSS